MTVYRSAIQQRSEGGTRNTEITERLFLATLIARENGPNPYKLIYGKFEKPWFSSPKAIEMRVRRFERDLAAQGPVSCKHILDMKYHQFLSTRRNSQVLRSLKRYDQKKLSYKAYSEELTRLIWPNHKVSLAWIDYASMLHSVDRSVVA